MRDVLKECRSHCFQTSTAWLATTWGMGYYSWGIYGNTLHNIIHARDEKYYPPLVTYNYMCFSHHVLKKKKRSIENFLHLFPYFSVFYIYDALRFLAVEFLFIGSSSIKSTFDHPLFWYM